MKLISIAIFKMELTTQFALTRRKVCLNTLSVHIVRYSQCACVRYVARTFQQLDLESFNRSLLNILYEQEGDARLVEEIDPGVWGYLLCVSPDGTVTMMETAP